MNVQLGTKPLRHAWLRRLEAAPQQAIADLIAGYADIHPYERADAPEAAHLLISPLAPNDAARIALAAGISAWLGSRRIEPIPAAASKRQRYIREVCEALEIVALLDVVGVAISLRRRFVIWNDWTSRLILSTARDARAQFWRTLASTQDLIAAHDPGIDPTGLMPLWLEICREAGGKLPRHYLAIGLLGLRRLPHGEYQSELPWLSGLAHWALARNPSSAEFKAEWLPLKSIYPRSPRHWRELISTALSAPKFQKSGVSPPAWWRDDNVFANIGNGGLTPPPLATYRPRPYAAASKAISELGDDLAETLARVDSIVNEYRAMVYATGDSRELSVAIARLVRKLNEKRGPDRSLWSEKARSLALEGLRWEPHNPHLWRLWREAMVAEGAVEAAELVGWEMVRRFSSTPHARNQLAKLLARRPDRESEAEALLREAIALFPEDVYARNQLASLVARYPNRWSEAESVLRETISLFLDDPYSRNQLAGLLAKQADRHAEAEALLRETMVRFRSSASARNQLASLIARQPERWAEAETLLRETTALFPDDVYSRNQLVELLAKQPNRRSEAEAVVERTKHQFPYDTYAQAILDAGPRSRNRLARSLIQDPSQWDDAEALIRDTIALFPNSPIARNQLAGLLAKQADRWAEAESLLRETMVLFPDDFYSRNQLAGLLAKQAGRRAEAEALLRETMAKFRSSDSARNQLAGLIARQPERWAEAESLLRETMALFPDDVYSRNQLAELLATQPNRRAEAEVLLRETMAKFPHDPHARDQLIEMLGAQPDRQAETEVLLRDTVRDFPQDTNARTRLVILDTERSLEPGIGDVVRFGAMRRLRSHLERGDSEARQSALEEVRRVLDDDPTFAYATVLAARHHIWGVGSDTLPPFAAAFEHALATEDREKLDTLAKRQPRLEALILVAQAVLGDVQAAARVEDWLRAPVETTKEPALVGLHSRLRPILRLIDGGRTVSSSINELRSSVIVALYDSNEALLGETLLAA